MGFSYSPKVITDGLVLYLDAANPLSYASGSTSWNDLSRGRNNGTLVNGPSFQDNSIVFDGSNEYVDCGNTVGNFGTSNFTLSAWIKTTSATRAILAKQVSLGWNGYNFFINSSGKLQIVVDWSNSQQYGYVVSDTGVTTGNWTHCVFVLNGADRTNWRIYINGVSDSFTEFGNDLTGTGIDNSTLFTVGKREYADSNTFGGSIQMVQIYNRALSAQEVQRNYQALKSRFGL